MNLACKVLTKNLSITYQLLVIVIAIYSDSTDLQTVNKPKKKLKSKDERCIEVGRYRNGTAQVYDSTKREIEEQKAYQNFDQSQQIDLLETIVVGLRGKKEKARNICLNFIHLYLYLDYEQEKQIEELSTSNSFKISQINLINNNSCISFGSSIYFVSSKDLMVRIRLEKKNDNDAAIKRELLRMKTIYRIHKLQGNTLLFLRIMVFPYWQISLFRFITGNFSVIYSSSKKLSFNYTKQLSNSDKSLCIYFLSFSSILQFIMHYHPHNSFCFDRNCQMKTHQEIQSIYEAKVGPIDLFDRLLLEKKQSQWADAESSAKMEEIEMQSTQNQMEEERQHHGCKCSKIGCLKLYCECFANGRQCNGNCVCSCCRNKQGNEQQIYQAKMLANLRHPNHFKGIPALTPSRKCTCKKSMCRKKYCQCFSAGLECTELCQCKDCQNGHPHSHSQRENFYAAMNFSMDMEVSCEA